MLADTVEKTDNIWKSMQAGGRLTYIPAVLLLLMALDNGWTIATVKETLSPVYGYETAYLVNLRSCSGCREQNLVIPPNPLVNKVLEEHAIRFVN